MHAACVRARSLLDYGCSTSTNGTISHEGERLVIRKKTNPDSVKQKENESFLFSKEFERKKPLYTGTTKSFRYSVFSPKTVVMFSLETSNKGGIIE